MMQGSDTVLEERLRVLLPLSALMLLPDGIQMTAAGVAQASLTLLAFVQHHSLSA